MFRANNSDNTVLISCYGDDTGGGLFAYDGNRLECLDRLSTTGLCIIDRQLHRLLRCTSEYGHTSDLLIYDTRGVKQYWRLDSLGDPHDIAWDGQRIVIVSTAENSIVWFSASGETVSCWQPPGRGDAWHLNCLSMKDGELLVTAFGQFQHHREWVGPANEGAGILFNVATGEVVLDGLTAPHTPRFVDDAWIVCNSGHKEILQINHRTREVERRLELKSWTRGIAMADEVMFVGESASRREVNRADTASIAVICRSTWKVLDRIFLPCREIYDLALASPDLVEGVRRGFRTNPLRVAEQDQLALFNQAGVQPVRLWATGDPLPPDACNAEIQAIVPREMKANSAVSIECTVSNRGTASFVSAPPNPIYLSYKWLDPSTSAQLPWEGLRTRLSHTLLPQQFLSCTMTVQTPPEEGKFLLRITLVQEMIAWFDDLDPMNQFTCVIQVTAA